MQDQRRRSFSALGSQAGWPFVGLLLLCLVPMLAGFARLFELAFGQVVSPGNARFFAAPLPVVLHILSSLVFSIGGVVQFAFASAALPVYWHRRMGCLLLASGLGAAFSGLWMTLFYPPATANFDGPALYLMRLFVGIAMVLAIVRGLVLARRREFMAHRAWMIRAYALGLGAGTQVLTHLPWVLFPELRGELLRACCMGAGWGINMLVAEWLIARQR